MTAMLRRAILRASTGRPWLGQWTPAFVLTLCATAITLFLSVAPHWYDMERYWLAWLGQRVLHGDFPHAAGAESPYDLGHPWMPVEWLYAVLVAWTGAHRFYVAFALVNGLAGAALVWWALGACIARRVPGNVTFIVSASCFLPVVERYELRAEAFGNAFLVAVLAWGAIPKRRLLLVPAFAIWVNVHPSFAFGLLVLALQTVDRMRRGDRFAIVVFAACALATACNPFGFALWQHVWWTSHGWVAQTVPEWLPLMQSDPLDALLLCVPMLSVLLRRDVRSRGLLDWALWPATAILSLLSSRFVTLATAVGAPAACGVFRQRDVPFPRPMVWVALAVVAGFGIRGLTGDVGQLMQGTAPDRDFGLIVARSSPAVVEHDVALRDRLVSCVPGWYCNVALYLGAKTLYDGRTEPFSARRIRELSASLANPGELRKWPIDVAIVPPERAARLEDTHRWRKVASSAVIAIFEAARR